MADASACETWVTWVAAAEAEISDKMLAIAAETDAEGKAPPEVTPGILTVTVVESPSLETVCTGSTAAEVVVSEDDATVAVTGTEEAVTMETVAETIVPVPRATEVATVELPTASAESSPQSVVESVVLLEVTAALVVEFDVALVLFKPAPEPSIPPETPEASMRATTSDSISQASEVPLLLMSGRAKQDSPCEHGVKAYLEPMHCANAPLTQASSPEVHEEFAVKAANALF
jgi:hypothetical protein